MRQGLIIFPNGTKRWYQDDKLHREGGPAVERNDGLKAWLVLGNFHREDGPAYIRADGTKEWWFEGTECTEDDPRVNGIKIAKLKRALKPVAFEKL